MNTFAVTFILFLVAVAVFITCYLGVLFPPTNDNRSCARCGARGHLPKDCPWKLPK